MELINKQINMISNNIRKFSSSKIIKLQIYFLLTFTIFRKSFQGLDIYFFIFLLLLTLLG